MTSRWSLVIAVAAMALAPSCGLMGSAAEEPVVIGRELASTVATSSTTAADVSATSASMEPPTTSPSAASTEMEREPDATTEEPPLELFTFVPLDVAADGMLGSGCAPGTDVLPDGIWFGSIASFDTGSIEFDLKCIRVFDGGGFEDVEITNSNPKLRTVPVATNAIAANNSFGFFEDVTAIRFEDFPSLYLTLPSSSQDVWIEIVEGELSRLEVPFSS